MTTDSQRRSLVPSFVSEQLEKAINTAIQYAPGTQAALDSLVGKSVCLITTNPAINTTLEICSGEIRINPYWEGSATVTIKGPLITVLFQIGLNKSPGNVMASGIHIEGDQALAQQLATIFKETDIDLEEPLAHWVGDVAAHQAGQMARSAFSWLKKTTHTLMDSSSHYLREESQQVVEKQELHLFSQDIDVLRADYDRLEARAQQLQKKSPSQTETNLNKPNPVEIETLTDNVFSPTLPASNT